MTVKLLTEHHLEFLSLKGGCTGSSESTLVNMRHCWKSHVAAQILVRSPLVKQLLILFSGSAMPRLFLVLNEGLTYPTHFLKSRGSGIRNDFLEYRNKKKSAFLRNETFFIHYSLQIQQNICSIDIFPVPVSEST